MTRRYLYCVLVAVLCGVSVEAYAAPVEPKAIESAAKAMEEAAESLLKVRDKLAKQLESRLQADEAKEPGRDFLLRLDDGADREEMLVHLQRRGGKWLKGYAVVPEWRQEDRKEIFGFLHRDGANATTRDKMMYPVDASELHLKNGELSGSFEALLRLKWLKHEHMKPGFRYKFTTDRRWSRVDQWRRIPHTTPRPQEYAVKGRARKDKQEFMLTLQYLGRPLPVRFRLPPEKWERPTVTMPRLNAGVHEGDFSGLTLKDGKLAGSAVIELNPDPFVLKHIHVVTYELNGEAKAGRISGTFEGSAKKGRKLKVAGQSRGAGAVEAPASFSGEFSGTVVDAVDLRYVASGAMGDHQGRITGGSHAPELAVRSLLYDVPKAAPEDAFEALNVQAALATSLYQEIVALRQCVMDYPFPIDVALAKVRVPAPQWKDRTAASVAAAGEYAARLAELAGKVVAPGEWECALGRPCPKDTQFGPYYAPKALTVSDGKVEIPEWRETDKGQEWRFIPQWEVTGPFVQVHGVDSGSSAFPDAVPAGGAVYEKAPRLGFKTPDDLLPVRVVESSRGVVNAPSWGTDSRGRSTRPGQRNTYWYAAAEIHAGAKRKVWVALDTRYHAKLWLNDRAVWIDREHEWVEDSLQVAVFKVRLEKGRNRFLVRCRDDRGGSWFKLHVCTAGSPRSEGEIAKRDQIAAAQARPATYGGDVRAYPDATPALAWDLEKGANILWKYQGAGGRSHPAIVGDSVFISSTEGKLHCLNRTTGKSRWIKESSIWEFVGEDKRKEWDDAPLDKRGRRNGQVLQRLTGLRGFGRDATPVSDGKRVWVHYGFGVTACYDMKGNRIWVRRTRMADCALMLIADPVDPLNISGLLVAGGITDEWASDNKVSLEGLDPRSRNGVMLVESGTGKTLWAHAGPGAARVEAYPAGGVIPNRGTLPRYPMLVNAVRDGKPTAFLITPGAQALDPASGKILVGNISFPDWEWMSVTQNGDTFYACNEGSHSAAQVWMNEAGQVGHRMLWRGRRLYAFMAGGSATTIYDGRWVYSYRRVNEHAKHCPASGAVLDIYDPATGVLDQWIKPIVRSPAPWPPVLAGEYIFLAENRGFGPHAGGPLEKREVVVIKSGENPYVICRNVTPYAAGIPVFDGPLMVMRREKDVFAASMKGEEGQKYQVQRLAETLVEQVVPQPETGTKRIAALAGVVPGENTPVDKFLNEKAPFRWLVAGPFPKSDNGHLPKALAGATKSLPAAGTEISDGGTKHALAPIPIRDIPSVTRFWNDGRMDDWQARGTFRTIPLKSFAEKDAEGVVYMFTVLDNTQDRVVYSKVEGKGIGVWLGGESLAPGHTVRLEPGLYPLAIRVPLPVIAKAKYSFAPQFKEVVDPQRACDAWLGQLSPRRDVLELIVRSLPDSEHARSAKSYLAHLREDDMRKDISILARAWRNDGSGRFPHAWPPAPCERNANVKWLVDLSARGSSDPVAVRDRVFIGLESTALACLDTKDGKVLWEQRLSKSKEPIGMAAPAVQGETVYAACAQGMVAAFGVDGKIKWQARVAAMKSDTGKPGVLVAGDVLVVQCGSLVGLGLVDGKEKWVSKAKVSAGAAPPVRVQAGSEHAVLTADGALVRAADGEVLAADLPATGASAPQVLGEIAYYAGKSVTAARRLPSKLVKGAEVEELWKVKGYGPCSTPLLVDGQVLMIAADGELTSLAMDSGRELYVEKLGVGERVCSLVLGGDNVYAVNVGNDGTRTVVFKPGPKFEKVWEYSVAGGSDGVSFIGRDQYIVAGVRLHAIGGKGPVEPVPVGGPEIAAVDIKPGDGVPVSAFESNVIAEKWLFAGPFKPRSHDTDFLEAIGGRAKAMPKEGQKVTHKDTTVAWTPVAENMAWRHGKFTGGVKSLDITATVGKEEDSSLYYYTVFDNEKARDVEFKLFSPRGEQWNTPALIKATVLVGGREVKENEIVYLQKGMIPVMVQVGKGAMTGGGKIWFAPRFIDRSSQFARKREEFVRASKVWADYQQQKDELFTLK